MKMALGDVAEDLPRSFPNLTRLITAGAYLAGVGFSIGGLMRVKGHKEAPAELSVGTLGQLLFVPQAVRFVDGLLAATSAALFRQAREEKLIAASVDKQAAADPAEGRFDRVAVPIRVASSLLTVSVPNSRFRPLLGLERQELVNEARLAAVVQAAVRALDRSSGALTAGDRAAYEKQKAAVARYLDEEAALFKASVGFSFRVEAAFRALKIRLHISHAGMLRLARYVRHHGLRGIRRGLARWGISLASVGLAGVSRWQVAAEFSAPRSRFDLSALFRPPAQQDVADLRAAYLLRAAARRVDKLP
jgi:hypothetical protein